MKKPTHKSNNMLHLAKARLHAAFSLIELLVVIAVIGVIAAIAIPNIANMTGGAETARAQRNAQTLMSMYSSAKAAGWVPTGADKSAVADLLIAGVNGEGSMSGAEFKVPNLSDDDRDDALVYIDATGGITELEYEAAGGN